jgi:hypothetical protein
MMNASMQSHRRERVFKCGVDRVVFEREDAGSASDTVTSIILYQSYTTYSSRNKSPKQAIHLLEVV